MNLEIKHLAPYLPYGLKVQCKRHWIKYGEQHTLEVNGIAKSDEWQYEFYNGGNLMFADITAKGFKPILRPLSQLTETIEHNGKKFVPMVKLAQIARLDTTKYHLGSLNNAHGIKCNIENDEDDDTHEVLGFDNTNGFGHHYKPAKRFTMVANQIQLWEKLHEWKFDVFNLIENNLAIAVTDELNPYK